MGAGVYRFRQNLVEENKEVVPQAIEEVGRALGKTT